MSPNEDLPPDQSAGEPADRPRPAALPPAHDIRTYVEDGARIAGILGVWGIIAAFCAFGIGNVGRPGSLFHAIGPALGSLFAAVGVLNALLFLIYRGIDYWHACYSRL
ncbi:hypothetical protein [Halorientalis salina]|uniref:hypothetical protein n=1 Tax=Halorientalis salina TaxID=2932266 RepID=UPI002022A133|nr:hypothetical protein [Halorientalis salina]